MKLSFAIFSLFALGTTFAKPPDSITRGEKTTSVLEILQHLQQQVRNDTAIIISTVADMSAWSAESSNATSVAAIQSALSHAIEVVEQQTEQIARAPSILRRGESFSNEQSSAIMSIVAGIIGDIGSGIAALLRIIQNSTLLQTLSGDLIKATLGLINALGSALIQIPHIQDFLAIIISIIKQIPI